MPELPEVETVARQVRESVVGHKITKLEVLDPKLSHLGDFKGGTIKDVFRYGKYICIDCEGSCLVIHLRMTGRLIVSSNHNLTPKYARVSFLLYKNKKTASKRLDFCDMRRFGTCEVAGSITDYKIGLEPLSPHFNAKKLKQLISGSRQAIKVWLLRQDKIVGIGNIYASEILYSAKIAPTRQAGSLKEEEIKLLCKETKRILKKAIKNCGTTFSDFQDSTGKIGNYQQYLNVYKKEGQKCKYCGAIIQKKVQAQRSTYFCGVCQH